MPRRQNSFARALADAEKRLKEALEELTDCQGRARELHEEIPRLYRIIGSLSGKEVPSVRDSTGFSNTRNSAVTGEHRAETSADLMNLVGPQDLSGMGSIVNDGPAPTELSEDDLLPEPEGKPLLEK